MIVRLLLVELLSANAELAAFVEEARRDRPTAWAAVETLQRTCRACQPVTPEGSAHAFDVLRRVGLETAAPASGGRPIEGGQRR